MSMKVNKVLPSPAELKEEYPLSEKLIQLKKERDAEIRDIFTGKSDKFAVIIGPCSADNEDSVCEYVSRLAKVNEKVKDRLMLIPRIDFSNEWGRVWTTLALTDKAYELGLSFYVTPELVMNYQPVRAFFLVFGMGCLICIFYGLCMWLLNIYLGKIISFAVIMASVLLVTRVEYMPPWMIYLVPSGWADVGNLSAYTTHGLSINKANLILIIGSIFLGILVYWKTIRIDIAKG